MYDEWLSMSVKYNWTAVNRRELFLNRIAAAMTTLLEVDVLCSLASLLTATADKNDSSIGQFFFNFLWASLNEKLTTSRFEVFLNMLQSSNGCCTRLYHQQNIKNCYLIEKMKSSFKLVVMKQKGEKAKGSSISYSLDI